MGEMPKKTEGIITKTRRYENTKGTEMFHGVNRAQRLWLIEDFR
ncbi:unnamed protein product, partial [marine sediment metagenome]